MKITKKTVRISRYSSNQGLEDAQNVDNEVKDRLEKKIPAQQPSSEIIKTRKDLENYKSIGQITENMSPEEKEGFRREYWKKIKKYQK